MTDQKYVGVSWRSNIINIHCDEITESTDSKKVLKPRPSAQKSTATSKSRRRIRDHASPEFGFFEIRILRAEGDEVYLPTVWVMNWLPAANLSCSWHGISTMRHPWRSRTNNIYIHWHLLASLNLLQLHRNNIINVEMDWEWSSTHLGSSSAEKRIWLTSNLGGENVKKLATPVLSSAIADTHFVIHEWEARPCCLAALGAEHGMRA